MKLLEQNALMMELREDPLLFWLPAEGLETMGNCFDMQAEAVSAGACCRSNGRLGYLLRGRGELTGEPGNRTAAPGSIFGVIIQEGTAHTVQACLRAETDCVLLWADGEILRSVCYGACWFHARFIREVRGRLTPSNEAKFDLLF